MEGARAGATGLLAASIFFEQTIRPLQTLANVVAALREDDFSFRARGARRGEVTPVTTLLSLTRLAHAARFLRRFEIHHEDDPEPGGLLPVATISGACFALTHEDYEALGGFDEGYFLHVEDVDLCWRMRQSGGRVLFAPDARVVHLGSTSHTSPLKVEFFKGLGLVRYFRKRADNPRRLLLAYALAPMIMLVQVVRPLLRRRR